MNVDVEIVDGYVALEAHVVGTDARFLLDTGADSTVVRPALADRLGLTTHGLSSGGVAGGHRIEVQVTELPEITVGPETAALSPVAVVELRSPHRPIFDMIDGVLGSDFLRRFPWTLDYRASQLVFESAQSLEARRHAGVELELRVRHDTSPYLSVRLNDRLSREYKLDTGAATCHVRMQDLHALGIDTAELKPLEKDGLGGTYVTYPTRLESFAVAPGLAVADLSVEAQESEIGFIGGNYLSHFAITLDYAGRTAIFHRQ